MKLLTILFLICSHAAIGQVNQPTSLGKIDGYFLIKDGGSREYHFEDGKRILLDYAILSPTQGRFFLDSNRTRIPIVDSSMVRLIRKRIKEYERKHPGNN